MLVVLPPQQEVLASARHQERLHEFLGHRDVEELAGLHLVAELDEMVLRTERDVRERPDRQLDRRVFLLADRLDRLDTELLDLSEASFWPSRRALSRGLGCHEVVPLLEQLELLAFPGRFRRLLPLASGFLAPPSVFLPAPSRGFFVRSLRTRYRPTRLGSCARGGGAPLAPPSGFGVSGSTVMLTKLGSALWKCSRSRSDAGSLSAEALAEPGM